jgi:sarcosine/dimethylglycine N-methyltransferase
MATFLEQHATPEQQATPFEKATFEQEESASQEYYDSEDAFAFYKHVWGGHHIHVGIYDGVTTTGIDRIVEASDKSLERVISKMAFSAQPLNSETQVMDMGSAYGGSARACAREYGCRVTCIDISSKENARNREMSKEQGMEKLIHIPGDLSFCDTGMESKSYDLVFSMDSFLHAGSLREKAVEEAARVLKPGGIFSFTDIMKADTATDDQVKPVYDRLKLVDMGCPSKYREWCERYNLVFLEYDDLTPQLNHHYGQVKENLVNIRQDLQGKISDAFMDKMISGLETWVETTQPQASTLSFMSWGVMTFKKAED